MKWYFLCIGSDRITGDSLGPLIGHRLTAYRGLGFYVYGTLDDPVHALNLSDRLQNDPPKGIRKVWSSPSTPLSGPADIRDISR